MSSRGLLRLFLGLHLLASAALAAAPDPAAALERALAAAEEGLRDNEVQIAESRYRTALYEGWLLVGALAVAEDDLSAARAAFEAASTAAAENRRALLSLALVEQRLGEATEAIALLRRLLTQDPMDRRARRLLAQVLAAAGRPEEAAQELEEALAAAPEDAESAFNLATGYLRLNKVEEAERLFARVSELRPIPQTRILIGRMLRDFGHYDLARGYLAEALRMDPEVPRARYYLGTIELLERGRDGIEPAVAWLEKEVARSPKDPLANLYLGLARVESWEYEAAIPILEVAAESPLTRLDALRFLGRCHLGLGRPRQAVAVLRQALTLADGSDAASREISTLHYQLALGLRRTGAEDEAATHFAAAEEYSAQQVEDERSDLTRVLSDRLDLEVEPRDLGTPIDVAGLEGLEAEERRELRRRVEQGLARSYLNLGVLQLRGGRAARAVEHFEQAAAADPDLPRVQHSLGVAYFNAGRFADAVGPLERALEQEPASAEVRRMLALAWLNQEAYREAADLLAGDPGRAGDPSLQYAYALALVRSGRAAEAAAVFDRLLSEHGEWPELHVLLGQASAQQQDFAAAVASLERALELDPKVAEAHATLGNLYLRQGELEKAEAELRAELATRPGDLRSRYVLATVLELDRKSAEARAQLERVLGERPDFADARYLLGKILLAEGAAEEAVAHLEAAAELAPEDWNVRYQLGQAYQRLGREEQAARQFEIYRELRKTEERETAGESGT